jgi:hypothetical protein
MRVREMEGHAHGARWEEHACHACPEGHVYPARLEGRACHARRSGIDNPMLRSGPDKQVPPKRGPDKQSLESVGKTHRETRPGDIANSLIKKWTSDIQKLLVSQESPKYPNILISKPYPADLS